MKNAAVAVVGAGAAGLMASIQSPGIRVIALDGAVRLGAKILIAGGGRCNVTHHAVNERDFHGSSPAAIRRVLRAFDVEATRTFFEAEGVTLVRESTGKLFPASNRASDVLDALTGAARRAGVELRHPARVTAVRNDGAGGFHVVTRTRDGDDTLAVRTVVLATGGRSVPKTGSDGAGYALARSLGLPLTPRTFPALVPLTLPDGHPLRALSGLATDVRLTVVSGTGRRLHTVSGALLCTHQGISGPAVLDVSRVWQAALEDDPDAGLLVDWVGGIEGPGQDEGRKASTPEDFDRRLQAHGNRPVRRVFAPALPDRLAAALCGMADVDPEQSGATLTREARRRLVTVATASRLPITGTRGFEVAEVTAGGVPLSALTANLEARTHAGVFVCGELCDVDGRIGGFNFQWSWASGTCAGRAAARLAVEAAQAPVSG